MVWRMITQMQNLVMNFAKLILLFVIVLFFYLFRCSIFNKHLMTYLTLFGDNYNYSNNRKQARNYFKIKPLTQL
jgi:hypothetical protein